MRSLRAHIPALAAIIVASAPLGAQQPAFPSAQQPAFPGVQPTVPGAPQTFPGASAIPQTPGMPAEYQKMIADMQAAQSSARRPGDESLSCEALKAEIEAAMNAAESVGGDPDELAAPDAPPAQAVQQQQLEYAAMLPHLARSQWLTELAVLKNCAWLADVGFPVGLDAGFNEAVPTQ